METSETPLDPPLDRSIVFISEAETPCQKWGGSVFMKFTIYIHSEILHPSFDPLTTKFCQKWEGGLKPPLPPQVLCLSSVLYTCKNLLPEVYITTKVAYSYTFLEYSS